MTWNELLRTELRRLHAQEERAAQTFEEMVAQASGAVTLTILREAIDGALSRMTRLEMILDPLDEPGEGRALHSFEGWHEDVRELGRGPFLGDAHDAALLGLLLRMLRTRTSCYEVAHILALNLDATIIAKLLGALWTTDRALDARVAETLTLVVLQGDGRWDLRELRA